MALRPAVAVPEPLSWLEPAATDSCRTPEMAEVAAQRRCRTAATVAPVKTNLTSTAVESLAWAACPTGQPSLASQPGHRHPFGKWILSTGDLGPGGLPADPQICRWPTNVAMTAASALGAVPTQPTVDDGA